MPKANEIGKRHSSAPTPAVDRHVIAPLGRHQRRAGTDKRATSHFARMSIAYNLRAWRANKSLEAVISERAATQRM